MKRLEGRVAIITGSGKGIGRTVTLGMVQEGAVAVIADRDRVLTLEVQEEVEKSGHRALPIPPPPPETTAIFLSEASIYRRPLTP